MTSSPMALHSILRAMCTAGAQAQCSAGLSGDLQEGVVPRGVNKARGVFTGWGHLDRMQVLGGRLNQVFEFHDAVASRQQYDISLSSTDPFHIPFTEPWKRHLRLGIREKGLEVLGTTGTPRAPYRRSCSTTARR